ncbi:MAG: PAS domain-containing protein [Rhodospirillales bacterium]|nr:PAS domain-containing protein [Rhodospirillales bacterium]
MTTSGIAQPDITLLLDTNGTIQKATLSKLVSRESMDTWLGRRWEETVGNVGGEKVRRMIHDARSTGVSAFRQVTQFFPSGLELPMEYTIVKLGAKAGLMAVGKNLRAVAELQSRLVSTQQTLERDYWKLREVEARYKHLFEASDEPVLLLNANTSRVVDANPAAAQAFALAPRKREDLNHRDFLAELSTQERNAFNAMLRLVREQGKAPAIVVRLGHDRKSWIVKATMLKSEPAPVPCQAGPSGRDGSVVCDSGFFLRRRSDGTRSRWLCRHRSGRRCSACQSRFPRPNRGRIQRFSDRRASGTLVVATRC